MTTIASRVRETAGVGWVAARLRNSRIGLSGRLILLTMSFVMLVQVLVYIPSSVGFVRSWLSDRLMGAQMIAVALSSTPREARNGDLERRLASGISGADAMAVRGSGTHWLVTTPGGETPVAAREVDLRQRSWWRALGAVVHLLFDEARSPVKFIGAGVPGVPNVESIEFVVDEAPLQRALIDYTRNFFFVSLLVSAGTAALLYLALHILVVRPVRHLASNIAAFAAHPEDVSRVIRPTGRTDEIGRAEEALARMETTLAGELRQKRHLADLGLAVSKINHELRNMLTTAQLLGDRIGEIEDPTVRGIAPRLVRTLSRAIAFCGATLAYGRASENAPQRRPVALQAVVEDQIDPTALTDGIAVHLVTRIPDGFIVDADPDQLGRVLLNLTRNAVEAMAREGTQDPRIDISAERRPGWTDIRVRDNGPGVPERVRGRLFNAFLASERSGGTGLGLPVADEIVRLHGGTIELEPTDRGASFLICLPAA